MDLLFTVFYLSIYFCFYGAFFVGAVKTGIVKNVGGSGRFTWGYGGENVSYSPPNQLGRPRSLTGDSLGNLYYDDDFSYLLRKINIQNIVATVGGQLRSTTDIAATNARLMYPGGLWGESNGNSLYISDTNNLMIRKLTLSTNILSTVYDARADITVKMMGIWGDNNGQYLYLTDPISSRILRMSLTVTGNPRVAITGTEAYTDNSAVSSVSCGVVKDIYGDTNGALFLASEDLHRVMYISTSGIITTAAGTGSAGYTGDRANALSAELKRPRSMCVDTNGDLFIADTGNNVIRRVSAGIISTIAGNGIANFAGDGGRGTSASFSGLSGIRCDLNGNLYIADTTTSSFHQP
jgi:hypothetical protein